MPLVGSRRVTHAAGQVTSLGDFLNGVVDDDHELLEGRGGLRGSVGDKAAGDISRRELLRALATGVLASNTADVLVDSRDVGLDNALKDLLEVGIASGLDALGEARDGSVELQVEGLEQGEEAVAGQVGDGLTLDGVGDLVEHVGGSLGGSLEVRLSGGRDGAAHADSKLLVAEDFVELTAQAGTLVADEVGQGRGDVTVLDELAELVIQLAKRRVDTGQLAIDAAEVVIELVDGALGRVNGRAGASGGGDDGRGEQDNGELHVEGV